MAPAPANLFSNATDSLTYKDNSLVCKPTIWTDLLVFYSVNYVAHAATMKTYPSESTFEKAVTMAFTLLLPATSVWKASLAIRRMAVRNGGSDLRGAARAGALCTVIRSETWKPRAGDSVAGLYIMHQSEEEKDSQRRQQGYCRFSRHTHATCANTPSTRARSDPLRLDMFLPRAVLDLQLDTVLRSIQLGSTKIQGTHSLPLGYDFAFLPPDADFEDLPKSPTPASASAESIACTHSIPKIVVATSQVIYAGVTLWQSRGDQIDRFYGYAAFGLTVTPYLLMSLINIVAQLLTPDYETLFLVTSEISDEAERRGGTFRGAVARLKHPNTSGQVAVFTNSPVTDSNTPPLFSVSRETETRWKITALPAALASKSAHNALLRIPQCAAAPEQCTFDKAEEEKEWRKLVTTQGVGSISGVAFTLTQILIVGLFSGFQARNSTTAQRAWTMAWLTEGHLAGAMFGFLTYALQPGRAQSSVLRAHMKHKKMASAHSTKADYNIFESLSPAVINAFAVLGAILWCVPAVGGLVIVGQELFEYGSCTHI